MAVLIMLRPFKHPKTGVLWFRAKVPGARCAIAGREQVMWTLGTKDPAEEKVRTGEMSEDKLVLKALTILKSKVERLTAERDALHAEVNVVTMAECVALTHRYLPHSTKVAIAGLASRLAKERGIAPGSQRRTLPKDGREVSVNVHPRPLLEEAEARLMTAA